MGRPALPVEVQRRFWVMVRAGSVPGDAADAIGVSRTVAWRWFREAGGVMPCPCVFYRAGVVAVAVVLR